MRTQATHVEQVETALLLLGALAITLRDAADQPLLEPGPGELPLWDEIVVNALFALDTDPEHLSQQLREYLAAAGIDNVGVEWIADQAWERAWMDRFTPMSFGRRLWIYPSHIAPPPADDTVNILLDPGLAFGTGTHPTTALCLRWLDSADVSGTTLLDYGCGSGILAIAAAKLGAKQVYACDIDDQALLATKTNAERNGVADRIVCLSPHALPPVQIDIVLANILSRILLQLHDELLRCLRNQGQLVLSGILHDQQQTVLDAYRNEIDFDTPHQLEDWMLLAGVKNGRR